MLHPRLLSCVPPGLGLGWAGVLLSVSSVTGVLKIFGVSCGACCVVAGCLGGVIHPAFLLGPLGLGLDGNGVGVRDEWELEVFADSRRE